MHILKDVFQSLHLRLLRYCSFAKWRLAGKLYIPLTFDGKAITVTVTMLAGTYCGTTPK